MTLAQGSVGSRLRRAHILAAALAVRDVGGLSTPPATGVPFTPDSGVMLPGRPEQSVKPTIEMPARPCRTVAAAHTWILARRASAMQPLCPRHLGGYHADGGRTLAPAESGLSAPEGAMTRTLLAAIARLISGASVRWIDCQPDTCQRSISPITPAIWTCWCCGLACLRRVRTLTRPVAAKDYWEKGLGAPLDRDESLRRPADRSQGDQGPSKPGRPDAQEPSGTATR